MSLGFTIRDLGVQDYVPVWKAMQAFTDKRTVDTDDEIWLLQHPRVFTQGQAGKAEHVLAPGDIPVIAVDRGGQVTYHGPGQLVGYILVDIRRAGFGVRDLVTVIEESLVAVLARYGVQAAPRADAPGVYVNGAKIAALGLRVRRGRSFHGLSLNLDLDLEPFSRINPCGHADMQVTRLSDLIDWQPSYSQALSEQVVAALLHGLGGEIVRRQYALPTFNGS
jgi:lipoyl(octanoyl) transferase